MIVASPSHKRTSPQKCDKIACNQTNSPSLWFSRHFQGHRWWAFMLYAQIFKLGFDDDLFVSYYLIPILVIFGFKESASQVFDKSPLKDIVVWTALINENVKNKTPSWILTMKRKMAKKHEGETGERWQEREKNLLPRVCDVTI